MRKYIFLRQDYWCSSPGVHRSQFTNLYPSFLSTQGQTRATTWLLYDYKNLRCMTKPGHDAFHFVLTSIFQSPPLQRASLASLTAQKPIRDSSHGVILGHTFSLKTTTVLFFIRTRPKLALTHCKTWATYGWITLRHMIHGLTLEN